MKLERWGRWTLARPDPQAIWPKSDPGLWDATDAVYHRSEKGGGKWEYRSGLPDWWEIGYGPLGLKFKIRPTSFKHTGLFPEQSLNWEWVSERVSAGGSVAQVLNLFGYTGAATVAAAKAGAAVCHVDASEGIIGWCRENLALNGLAGAPVRTIKDDSLKFVRREIKRGKRYDGIILDPPAFGQSGEGDTWKLNEHLWALLGECRSLLSDKPLFVLLNSYTARFSPVAAWNLMQEFSKNLGGKCSFGELALRSASSGVSLPCGVYARWSSQ